MSGGIECSSQAGERDRRTIRRAASSTLRPIYRGPQYGRAFGDSKTPYRVAALDFGTVVVVARIWGVGGCGTGRRRPHGPVAPAEQVEAGTAVSPGHPLVRGGQSSCAGVTVRDQHRLVRQ